LKESRQPDVDDPTVVRPLTKRTLDGQLYERPASVQHEIATVLGLGSETLLASAETLRDETLVYLIRERRRAQDWTVARGVSEVLMERCRRVLLGTLASLPQNVREEAIRRVLEQLFARIVALDDDRGDFFQVRFGQALKRLRTSAFRQCVLTIARDQLADAGDDEWPDSRNAPFDPRQWPDDNVAFTDALNGLEAIRNERHRMAFALHAMQEMPIESEDPAEQTISRYFGVSARTIQNWLNHAEADLARWRKGKS